MAELNLVMELDLEQIKKRVLAELEKIKDKLELETARIRHLGRSSELNGFLRSLKNMTDEERRFFGAKANALRKSLEEEFERRSVQLGAAIGQIRENFDISKPAAKLPHGHIHILSQVQEDVGRIFSSLGFEVLNGPEVESEFNNFDALNIPADHPARALQDTFWLKQSGGEKSGRHLLRTHTSPMQIRYMQTHEPPLKIVVPGRVYRSEATDATHEFQFHQFEGLAVSPQGDNAISLANLKGVLEYFFSRFFRDEVQVRFMASYFPFTEPSVEVYVKRKSAGKIKNSKLDDWLEVAGAGMVHQNVFKAVGYAPGQYQGFAFGAAIERLAMIKYKIDDIRHFHSGDLRFLEQF